MFHFLFDLLLMLQSCPWRICTALRLCCQFSADTLDLETDRLFIYLLIYLFIYLFIKAYSPVNRTGSPQGFSQVQILHKLNKKAINMHVHKNKHKQHFIFKDLKIVLLVLPLGTIAIKLGPSLTIQFN